MKEVVIFLIHGIGLAIMLFAANFDRTKDCDIIYGPRKRFIAIMLIMMLGALMLNACQQPEVIPSCDWVEVSVQGDRASIKIHSDSPQVIMTHENGKSLVIRSQYYNCTRVAVLPNEILTFTDKASCEVALR